MARLKILPDVNHVLKQAPSDDGSENLGTQSTRPRSWAGDIVDRVPRFVHVEAGAR